MYNCPNCSGNLSFDIASQMLKCEYCDTKLDPYKYQKSQDAEERDDFGVTVFTCPQCGGEIMATNVTAAGFCTYCGASTILDSRISTEKCPRHIIPFSKTKDDCRDAYSKLVKKAFFAPRQLRDPENLERFRGIYMPYWVYDYKLQGTVGLEGEKSRRQGDYVITDHYALSGEVDAVYDGIAFDASSSFDDTVAAAIAPFRADRFKPFTPSILCGFYADAPDVDSSAYKEKLSEILYDDSIDRLSGVPEFTKNGLKKPDFTKSSLSAIGINVREKPAACAYLPVWFLTYRKNDRVAYAVMNGDTGKITADLPIDEKKYLLGSLILTVPIFAVLAFLLTLTGKAVLLASSVLALFSLFLYMAGVSLISDKESHVADIGYAFSGSSGQPPHKDPKAKRQDHSMKPERGPGEGIKGSLMTVLMIAASVIISICPLYRLITNGGAINYYIVYGIVSLVILVVLTIFIKVLAETDGAKKNILIHTIGSCISVLVSAAILEWNPVSDLWYYGGSILAAVGICITFIGIIRKFNILATRPLPTFYDRKGGNDRAR